MAKGMSTFLGISAEDASRAQRYERMSGKVSKIIKRQMEEDLLVPEKLPMYMGAQSKNKGIEQYVIKIVVKSLSERTLISKFFKISETSITQRGKKTKEEHSIIDVRLLLDLLREMDEGRIVYDKEDRSFSYGK